MLRDRAHLGEGEVAKAVGWAMHTLLEALYRDQARLARQKRDKGKSGERAAPQRRLKDRGAAKGRTR
ncbi:MAG TPA: hypothetical protein VM865_00965, partial [Acidobacteriaceae bacterium]|nr:hypothetical protein [Acidobacteriaceae bacterium]